MQPGFAKAPQASAKSSVKGVYPSPFSGNFINAAHSGDLVMVQTMVAAGADINAKDMQGRTALMGAAGGGHAPVVQVLLDAKADVNDKTGVHYTALLLAKEYGHADVVKLLQQAGAK